MFDRILNTPLFLLKTTQKILNISRQNMCGEAHFQKIFGFKVLYNFIEITLRHGCSPVNVL